MTKQSKAASEAFHSIEVRLHSAKSTLACAVKALGAADACDTDEDVGHAERVLQDLVETIDGIQSDLDSFNLVHIAGTRLSVVAS